MRNKILITLLTVAVLLCAVGFTANAATKATAITFSKTSDAKVRVGYAITRAATTTPADLIAQYTSSDSSIATVNENGKVVGKKPGKVVITALAGGLKVSYNVTVIKADTVPSSTKVFEGFNVTVLDMTTPAVNVRGKTNDRTVICFVSSSDKEVGVISHSDYNAIIQKNQKVVKLSGDGTYSAPPVEGKSWEAWFADEFNKYRGLAVGSRDTAVAANNVETIEDFQQKLISLTNSERHAAGKPNLITDELSMEFAQIRAQEITTHWSHSRPNGEGLTYGGLHFTEIIHKGSSTPQDAINGWMNSDGHRAVLLGDHEEYGNRFGVGVVRSDNDMDYYWVEVFVLWDPDM